MAAWVREEENASNQRQKKREATSDCLEPSLLVDLL